MNTDRKQLSLRHGCEQRSLKNPDYMICVGKKSAECVS